MAISFCTITLILGMESVTCKGREAYFEPSQFHAFFMEATTWA